VTHGAWESLANEDVKGSSSAVSALDEIVIASNPRIE
jgi:hypothetical protein